LLLVMVKVTSLAVTPFPMKSAMAALRLCSRVDPVLEDVKVKVKVFPLRLTKVRSLTEGTLSSTKASKLAPLILATTVLTEGVLLVSHPLKPSELTLTVTGELPAQVQV
jgi:hypothetical protein